MNVIDLEILIPASPEFIWRFLGDLSALPQWQEDVDSVSFLSTQRDGRSTRWRASSDNNNDMVVEISAWYDTLGYEYSVKDGTSFAENQGRIRLHEVTDGTLVRWTFQYELKGMLGGLRNSMRIKRGTTNQIQASLRNLHQLISQESGGISTHEAKASVKEAPDVGERLTYKPRHPSTFQDPALEELSASETDTDTDKQPAFYDFEPSSEPVPAAVDTDTKPNPVVLAPGFELEIEGEPDVKLDDTKPVVIEALFEDSAVVEPEPAAALPSPVSDMLSAPMRERPSPPLRETRDTAELSVFEIFGLQKPSEARAEARLLRTAGRKTDRPDEISAELAQRKVSHIETPEYMMPPATVAESASGSITGLRRRARRGSTMLRSHT
ncbi:MAG: SRPBCC family protein [Chloroflexi bacterium]|nr:SRPBCC family protein [Chloroflexota bacterium]